MYTPSQIRELLATITDDDENLLTAEERVDIGHAVQLLPTPQDRLVVLCLVQGQSDTEAARALGVRTTAARVAIRKVLRQLRDTMNQGDKEDEEGHGDATKGASSGRSEGL